MRGRASATGHRIPFCTMMPSPHSPSQACTPLLSLSLLLTHTHTHIPNLLFKTLLWSHITEKQSHTQITCLFYTIIPKIPVSSTVLPHLSRQPPELSVHPLPCAWALHVPQLSHTLCLSPGSSFSVTDKCLGLHPSQINKINWAPWAEGSGNKGEREDLSSQSWLPSPGCQTRPYHGFTGGHSYSN